MEKNKQNKTRVILVIIATLIVMLVVGMVIYSSGSPARKLNAQLELGEKYLNDLDYEKAVAAFKEALSIEPDSEEAMELLVNAYSEWAKSEYEEGNPDRAIEILDEGYKYTDNDELGELIDIYNVNRQIDQGQNYLDNFSYEQAVQTFQEILANDPESEEASKGLIDSYTGWFDQAMDSDKPNEAYVIMESALKYYLDFLAENEKNEGAYLGIVECYISLGDIENAIKWAEEGYDKIGSDALKEVLERLNSGSVMDSSQHSTKITYRDEDGKVKYVFLRHFVDGEYTITCYGPENDVVAEYQPEYDEFGNEIVTYSINGKRGLTSKYINTYENGLKVRSDCYNLPDLKYNHYTLYEYDENSRLVRRSRYTTTGSPSSYYVYEYTEDGYLIQYYSSWGKPGVKEFHEYGEDGKTVKKIYYYDGDGNITSTADIN